MKANSFSVYFPSVPLFRDKQEITANCFFVLDWLTLSVNMMRQALFHIKSRVTMCVSRVGKVSTLFVPQHLFLDICTDVCKYTLAVLRILGKREFATSRPPAQDALRVSVSKQNCVGVRALLFKSEFYSPD